MDKKEFQAAFSVVQASQAFKEEVLEMTQNNPKSSVRLLPKLLLVAAIIALLTTTAFAAVAIVEARRGDAVKNGTIEHEGTEAIHVDNAELVETEYANGQYDLSMLYLDLEVNPDAPETLEDYYLPMLGGEYVQDSGYVYIDHTSFHWTPGQENSGHGIAFSQQPCGVLDPDEAIEKIYYVSGTTPQTGFVTLGGVSGYLIRHEFIGVTRTTFYWSDGDYLFRICTTLALTDTQLAEIINSMVPVADIEPYLMEHPCWNDGSGITYDYHSLNVYLYVGTDAPMLVEEYYMPVLSQDYVPYFGEDLNQKATQFGWTNGLRNWDDEIMFFQRPGGTYDPTATEGIFTLPGEAVDAAYVTLGEIYGYLVEDTRFSRRHFFWSNGDYVFHIFVPDKYSDAQLTALVESVRPVPSIDPYLVDAETHYQIVYGDRN